jgi:hypothetical protein
MAATRTNTKPSTATTDAPKATRTRKANPAPSPESQEGRCRCGCGEVARRYRPGHDARHAGQIGRSLVGMNAKQAEAALAPLETAALIAKARRVADSEAARQARAVRITEGEGA